MNMKFKPEYNLADPICTFVFSALVMATTVPIVKDIYYVLMEGKIKSIKFSGTASSIIFFI